MSLLRSCYLCGKPVSVHRRMSVFCSDRCEERYRVLSAAGGPLAAARPPVGAATAPQTPPGKPPRLSAPRAL